ncbi:hypothetical protein phiPsal1_049 [Pontimonas phage phiPsal1]|nr:hypothetical protein phiPsal1_049 [Pontimonas phage phiPsal1]
MVAVICVVVYSSNYQPRRNQMDYNKMIARYTRFGRSQEEAIELLNDLVNTFAEKNLPSALLYNDFITASQAKKMAA